MTDIKQHTSFINRHIHEKRFILKNLSLAILIALFGCGNPKSETEELQTWDEKGLSMADGIKQGVVVKGESEFQYNRNGEPLFRIKLQEPSVIAVAEKPQGWGFFQFPNIYRNADGTLVAKWNMAADDVSSYGKGGHGVAFSKDGGKTWAPDSEITDLSGGIELTSGDHIKVYTPQALKVSELHLPPPVARNDEAYGRKFSYYKLASLPNQLQGVYLDRLKKGETEWKREHVVLNDPQAVRYTDGEYFPVVWWGDMRIAADGALVNGIYPGFAMNDKGGVDPSGVFFYRSTDEGKTWDLLSRIPYEPNLAEDPNGDKRHALGWTEPGFEILSDGTWLCVLRTTDGLGNSPMYVTRSADQGKTWSRPEPFTRAGVLPRVLQLDNGVVVLASGRPGVQLRFSLDGEGKTWTDPFEMMPFEGEEKAVSCGYTELLEMGPDRFLIIYSDFKYPVENNEVRKAIKVREVIVTPKGK
jgi:hypothetical protein